MNKQTVIGFVLIGAILFGFSWYNGSQQRKAAEVQRVQDSIARANAPAVEPIAVAADSLSTLAAPTGPDPLGETMGAARGGEARKFTVANDVATYEFSTLGGMLSDVALKNYKKYGTDESVHLWRPGSESFDVSFFLRRGGRDAQVNTREFNFAWDAANTTEWAEGEEVKRITMRLPVDSVAYVEFVYSIPRADYMIDYDVRFVGMEGRLSNQSSFDIEWSNVSLQNEKGFDNENTYTTIAYRYPDVKNPDDLGVAARGGAKEKRETSRVRWVAFKQHFFSSFLIADGAFQNADMDYTTAEPGTGAIKKFHTRVGVPFDGTEYGFKIFFGPNKSSILRGYGESMDRVVSMGFWSFGWLTRLLVIPIFDWLGGRIASFGWIILILTVIIKTLISPLTLTSYKSSAKMRVLKPEMDAISAKYPDQADAMKKQQATMELYRHAGVNPLAGCLPMLIQMPFLLAMFRFFPQAIELRGQRLWWADDLSSYDSVYDFGFNVPWYGDHISLFTLLLAVSMYFSSRIMMAQQSGQPQMAGMKFVSLYMMPLMMLFFLNNFSAGLNYYYLISTIFSIIQIYAVRAFINEDKLRARMLEAAKKPKPKSSFLQRLEEAQKAQAQQAQRRK